MATIVLADDHDDLRALYAIALRADGHEVREVGDGDQAVHAVRDSSPDLLILDLWMPRLNGFGVLEALRDEPALGHVPVAMLSAMDEGDTQLECFALGASEYWLKGMSLAEFGQKVQHLLATSACE